MIEKSSIKVGSAFIPPNATGVDWEAAEKVSLDPIDRQFKCRPLGSKDPPSLIHDFGKEDPRPYDWNIKE